MDRELLRTRRQTVEHRNDVARQIKSKLLFYGIPSPFAPRHGWGQSDLQWLKGLDVGREGLRVCFKSLIELYEYLNDQLIFTIGDGAPVQNVVTFQRNIHIFDSSPTITSPANGAIGISTTPTFQWSYSGSVQPFVYKVEVYDAPSLESSHLVWVGYSGTNSVSVPADKNLAPNTTYYWLVAGVNEEFNGGTVSEIRSFTPYPSAGIDFDGDRKTDIAVYHAASGLWFIRQSSNGASYYVGYGGTVYVPVPGDYDGDGKADVAIYHSGSGLWFIKPSSGAADYYVGYGGSGYVPVPGDYDGDGKADIAVYHSASGLWFIKPSLGGADYYVGYGGPDYTPVNLDYLHGYVY